MIYTLFTGVAHYHYNITIKGLEIRYLGQTANTVQVTQILLKMVQYYRKKIASEMPVPHSLGKYFLTP